MKTALKLSLAAGLVFLPAIACSADKGIARPLSVIAIGKIARVESLSPSGWGMSGIEMIKVSQSSVGNTPIMRTLSLDARTVEILSLTQAPPLRASDIRLVTQNGRELIGVRGFQLMEVMPSDATAERMSTNALAHKWASLIGHVLPQVAPMPSRFGI